MIPICFNLSKKLQGGTWKMFSFFANIKSISYSSPLHQKRQPIHKCIKILPLSKRKSDFLIGIKRMSEVMNISFSQN